MLHLFGRIGKRQDAMRVQAFCAARTVDAEEQALIQQLVPYPAVEAPHIAILQRLAWRNGMRLTR
jgi:hypothetical protein